MTQRWMEKLFDKLHDKEGVCLYCSKRKCKHKGASELPDNLSALNVCKAIEETAKELVEEEKKNQKDS